MLNQLLNQVKEFAWKWIPKIYCVHVNTINAYMNLSNSDTKYYILSIEVSRMNGLPFTLKFKYKSFEEMESDLPSVFMRVVEALEPTILLSENCLQYITERIESKMNAGAFSVETWVENRFCKFLYKTSALAFIEYYIKSRYKPDLNFLYDNELIESPFQRHGMQWEEVVGTSHFGGSEPVPTDMDEDYSLQLNHNKALLTYHERCPICHYPTEWKGHRCILTQEQL